MSYKQLYIFIEGDIDRRFFEKIISPVLKEKYNGISYIEYSKKSNDKINQYINSIRSMGADYIFITDIDMEECQIKKTQKICEIYPCVTEENTAIVIKEIESWYLAGLNSSDCKKFKVKDLVDTNLLTKEQFIQMIPRKYPNALEFMLEILKCFSVKTARTKNNSFLQFSEKYGIG